MDVKAAGASIVQVETLGKSGVMILWLSSVMAAVAVVGLGVAVISWQRMSAHVAVLEYDLMSVKSKLVSEGVIEGDGH